jgi:hypothetical protein
MNKYFFSILFLVIALLSVATDWYHELSLSLCLILIIMILDKMGKGIVLRETIGFLYVLTCLVLPVIGYSFYTRDNTIARLWLKYMPVEEQVYFTYSLPAVAFFCFGLLFPVSKKSENDLGEGLKALIERIKVIISSNNKIGLTIVIIGIIASLAINFLPTALQFFASLFFLSSFTGLLYIYYSPAFKYKTLVMIFFGLFILNNAISGGMFTIIAYMGITIFSFLMLNRKISMLKKVGLLLVAVFALIVLQNAKMAYRKQIWLSSHQGSKAALFGELLWKNIEKGDNLITTNALFPVYTRTNQGFNVALVMLYIPKIKPHDQGNRLLTVAASAFVPRFLWPDKPEAGGVYNMKYYAGVNIKNWSTNIGPLGEAYGAFGATGGVIYMFLLGLFLRWAYLRVLVISNRIPLLICWLPVLFFQIIYSAETDSLQILNSLIKSSFFLWILYKLLPQWFGIKKPEPTFNENQSIGYKV